LAPCFRMGKEFSLQETSATTFTYQGPRWTIPGLQTNLCGGHQMVNATNALAVLETAVDGTFPISLSAIRNGLQAVKWRGRLEIVQRNPLLIVDGAHNLAGAQVLFDFLHSQIHDGAGRKLILVVGMMRDKNLQGFLRVFFPLVDHLIFTQPRMERAASVDELKQAVDREDLVPCLLADSWEAVCRAKDISNPADVICVTGSLFLVGEVLKRLTQPDFPT
jgi:dihydrofolate synthase / folylpolyglutamate synthase